MVKSTQSYLNAGLCALPAKAAQKRPAIPSWKTYQKRLPTDAEMSAWLANHPDGVCIVCGKVSGNLEVLDFDNGGELFDAWEKEIPSDMLERLVIEQSPSGGFHVFYRSEETVCGNLKLAARKTEDGHQTLIETRGEGGLILCAPTPGYEIIQGDLCNLPVLTSADREILLQTAANLDECPKDNADNGNGGQDNADNRPWSADNAHNHKCVADNTDNAHMPGSDYNIRGDVRSLLQSHGWVRVKGGENEYWRRPGKDKGNSATFDGTCFYVFSPNAAPFESEKGYSPFSVYIMLEHNGDKDAAARALSAQGYGCGPEVDPSVDISAIVGMSASCATHNANISNCPADNADICKCAADNADNAADMPTIQSLTTLIRAFDGLNPPIIHGLLREGETMNIIASPKVGKSWLVSTLAISIASGIDWLGMTIEPGRVLHIDNELHCCTTTYRYGKVGEAMGLSPDLYSDNIDVLSLRGHLRDLYAMGALFKRIEAGEYKIVIVDAFYRTLPEKTDENDNGAIANLYNHIDRYAGELDCAFVLIHHTSKGNQAGKSVTDVGAGAGSQSRAADTHLILRPHEEDDVTVLESAVRSWAPMEPKALLWNWPLFTVTDEVDTSALQGLAKAKAKPKEIDLTDFIDLCIAPHDPCSKASVRHDASRLFDLPERKADDRLQVAIDRGLASKIKCGARMMYVKNRPGVSGDKGLWAAALIANQSEMSIGDIAEAVGISERHARRIRTKITPESPDMERTSDMDMSGHLRTYVRAEKS